MSDPFSSESSVIRFLSLTGALALLLCAPLVPAQEEESSPVFTPRHQNRLIHETSPYLKQHAHNPVDWYPWGEEAFARAGEEGKPVFLSIGYSACHWCHVMERECFENDTIAALMNECFVCIKVDREERPDLDEIYMKATQMLTGGGGWPMSVWLTPDRKPFSAGTYFPPEDRWGRPGFPRVCRELSRRWKEDRSRVEGIAEQLTGEIGKIVGVPPGDAGELPDDLLAHARDSLLQGFDAEFGGFGGAPKFPHPMDLSLLLCLPAPLKDATTMHVVRHTLEKMRQGGIYDQLGGGFHRYSVDERWSIPHFEKMLYDNALLAGTYLDAWRVFQDEDHARVVREILDYVLREMTSPAGGFYATQDADSEGEEGRFFAWTPAEVREAVGADADLVCEWFGVTEGGNFENQTSVLWQACSPSVEALASKHQRSIEELRGVIERARRTLFEVREKRVKPGRDEKVLVDWNGLMIGAFARAGFQLGEARYLDAACMATDFIREQLWRDGRLLRCSKDGRARFQGNLGDYAMLIEGLIDLFQARSRAEDLCFAKELLEATLALFRDEESGGFFFTAADHETLIVRSKEAHDGATPSATSVHVSNLLRLSDLLADPSLRGVAEETLRVYRPLLARAPQAVSRMVAAVAWMQSSPVTVVLCAKNREQLEPMLEVMRGSADFARLCVVVDSGNEAELVGLSPLFAGKVAEGGRPSAYVCRDFTCLAPAHTPQALRLALERR